MTCITDIGGSFEFDAGGRKAMSESGGSCIPDGSLATKNDSLKFISSLPSSTSVNRGAISPPWYSGTPILMPLSIVKALKRRTMFPGEMCRT